MGYKPQVGDLIQFTLTGQFDGQVCMNTFLYTVGSRTAGAGGPELIDVGDKLTLEIWDVGAGMQAICTSNYINVVGVCQVIKPSRTVATVSIPVTNPSGNGAAPAAPSGVSAVVRRKGTLAGKHNQGRLFIPAIPAADIQDSEIVLASATDLALNGFSPILTNTQTIVVGGITLVIAPVLAPLPAGTPLVPITITSYDRVIRYQRRRELRVGI